MSSVICKRTGVIGVPRFNTASRRLAAAALPDRQQQHSVVNTHQNDEQSVIQQEDHGLTAFKSMIADRRFVCTQCGKCCTGDGEVWITDVEAQNIAAHLGVPLRRFEQQYTKSYSKVEGFKLLQSQSNPTRDCIFLQPDNTCSIHRVRPLQCSTYPWWPDLMTDSEWAWEKEHICEGFDHPDAPPTDVDDAARQLRAATAMEYKRMLARKPSKKQRRAAAAAAATLGADEIQPFSSIGQQPSLKVASHGSRQHSHADLSTKEGSASSQPCFNDINSSPLPLQQHVLVPPAVDSQDHEPQPAQQAPSQPSERSSSSAREQARDRWQQRLLNLQQLTDCDAAKD